jgi:polyisoprenoid-binding protein YceI
MRDGHLKSDDFFNAEKFPEINFKSTSFEKLGDNKYKITGDLTIRDVTKNVTFDATLNGTLKTDRGVLAAWKATTTINRFDYNLKWSKTLETGGLAVGKDVIITLNLELNK